MHQNPRVDSVIDMRAILTFHSIEDSGSVLSFDTALFEALLASLARKGIPVCDLDTLLSGNADSGIAITFDDGMKSVFANALPILKDFRAPAHMFLTTGEIGVRGIRPGYSNIPSIEMLDWNEVEALHMAGVHMECHTHTHPDMRNLNADQMIEECAKADQIILSRLGRSPEYFAYPYGYSNAMARDLVRVRYSASLTTDMKKLGDDYDPAALPRIDTYYLRSETCIGLLDSPVMQGYLMLRQTIRTLRNRNYAAPRV